MGSSALQPPNSTSMVSSPKSPQPQLSNSPTPRVIQYAGRGKGVPESTPQSPGPVTHNPTTPTWTVAGSRPVVGTKPQHHTARPGIALHQPVRPVSQASQPVRPPSQPTYPVRTGSPQARQAGPRHMILAQQQGQLRPQASKQQPRLAVANTGGLQVSIPRPSSTATSPEKLVILMGQGKDMVPTVSPGKAKSLTPADRQDVANILANLSGIMVEPAHSITTAKIPSPRPAGGLRPSLTVSTTDKRPSVSTSICSPGRSAMPTVTESPGSSSVTLKEDKEKSPTVSETSDVKVSKN